MRRASCLRASDSNEAAQGGELRRAIHAGRAGGISILTVPPVMAFRFPRETTVERTHRRSHPRRGHNGHPIGHGGPVSRVSAQRLRRRQICRLTGYSDRCVGSMRALITLSRTRRQRTSGMIPMKGVPSAVPLTSGPTHANSLRSFQTIRERSSSPRCAVTRGGIAIDRPGS